MEREKVFISIIDSKKCFECGSPVQEMHHVVPVVLGGTRVIPLCESCHGKVHNLEREGHSRLIKEGLQKRKEAGKNIGASPFGFKTDKDGNLIPNRKEQATIKKAIAFRMEGMVLREIIIALAEHGYFNRVGRPFTIAALHKIIRDCDIDL
jgi:hypothetical protein